MYLKNKPFSIWVTGMPRSGKTKMCTEIVSFFMAKTDIKPEIVSSAILRDLNDNSDFSMDGRIRQMTICRYIDKKIMLSGGVPIVDICSPDAAPRKITFLKGDNRFEVNVNTPKPICIERDSDFSYRLYEEHKINDYEPFIHDRLINTNDFNTTDDVLNAILFTLIKDKFLVKNCERAMFIGRFQPFHEGHEYIIRQKLDEGMPISIAIRLTDRSEKNPYTISSIKESICKIFKGDDVHVFSIPDIKEVCFGRDVGYGLKYIDVPDEIKEISGTKIRKENNNE